LIIGGVNHEIMVIYLDKCIIKKGKFKMKNPKDREDELNEIEKLIKPQKLLLILRSLILIAPYGHLILQILSEDYSKLLLTSIIVLPTIVLLTLLWREYIYNLKRYKKVAMEIQDKGTGTLSHFS